MFPLDNSISYQPYLRLIPLQQCYVDKWECDTRMMYPVKKKKTD